MDEALRISILAPAWGGRPARISALFIAALFQFSPLRGGRLHGVVIVFGHLLISILAPARGATGMAANFTKTTLISILAPARGATTHSPLDSYVLTISILAPARGATWCIMMVHQMKGISIPAPTRGATSSILSSVLLNPYFNSRARVGGDFAGRLCTSGHPYFNSRPRTGGDLDDDGPTLRKRISIPAPARGATYTPSLFSAR